MLLLKLCGRRCLGCLLLLLLNISLPLPIYLGFMLTIIDSCAGCLRRIANGRIWIFGFWKWQLANWDPVGVVRTTKMNKN
jgi:hypothetical protein